MVDATAANLDEVLSTLLSVAKRLDVQPGLSTGSGDGNKVPNSAAV